MNGYELTPAQGKAIGGRLQAPLCLSLGKNQLGWSEISVQRSTRPGEIVFSYVQGGDTVTLNLYNNVWTTVRTPVTPVYSVEARGRFNGLSRNFDVAGSYGVTGDTLHIALQYAGWVTTLNLDIPLDGPDGSIKVTRNHEQAATVATARK